MPFNIHNVGVFFNIPPLTRLEYMVPIPMSRLVAARRVVLTNTFFQSDNAKLSKQNWDGVEWPSLIGRKRRVVETVLLIDAHMNNILLIRERLIVDVFKALLVVASTFTI